MLSIVEKKARLSTDFSHPVSRHLQTTEAAFGAHNLANIS